MLSHQDFWWRFFPKKELTQMYVSVALRSFAISLIGIFIPLYLLHERAFSLEETIGFFLVYSVLFAIGTPLAAAFSSRFGVKHGVLVSIPLYLLFIIGLYLLPYVALPLALIAAFLGLSQAFYWMGMHLVFHHVSHPKHLAEEVGKRGSATIVAGIVGPFFGGVLITLVGFPAVFAFAALFLFLSGFMLFRSQENHIHYHFSLRSVFDTKRWKDSLFFVSRGTHIIAEGVIWPILIFFILGSYVSLGVLGSLVSMVSVILLWVAGKYSDHTNKRKMVRSASVIESFAWLLRAFVQSAGQVFAVTFFSAVMFGVREPALGAMEYNKAQGQVAGYFVNREIFICLGRVLLLSFVLLADSLSQGMVFQAVMNFAVFLF